MTSATGNQGFTLLELLVVLAILVLLVAAWPFATRNLFPKQQLTGAAQTFISDLRTARMQARLSGRPVPIGIAEDGSSYSLRDGVQHLSAGILLSMPGETRHSGVFFPDGSSNIKAFQLTLGTRTAIVRLGAITGRPDLL